MLKKTIATALLVLLIFTLVTGFDYRQDNWYSVEDWEVKVCSKWGGREQAQTHTGGVMSTQFHKQAATIQGHLKEKDAGDEKVYVHEISWYLQPIEGSEEYEIIMKNEHKNKKVRTGSATANSGDAGYYAGEHSTNYTKVVLDYDSGKITAPIVK